MEIKSSITIPFNLAEIQKYDETNDKLKLRGNFFKLGKKYFEAATLIFPNFELMDVTLANISFSCELLLKAILFGFNKDFKKIHKLNELFKLLPESERNYIKENIAIDRKKEFDLCLQEQDNAFAQYRYLCEAKSIAGNYQFLFAFAHILIFVYESLEKEMSLDISNPCGNI